MRRNIYNWFIQKRDKLDHLGDMKEKHEEGGI